MTEEEIREKAIEFAKRNKNRIAKELTDPEKYKPDPTPISVFMAGSPGAGKTEYSKNLISRLEKLTQRYVVRIDSDEIRPYFSEYTGRNSRLFQGATALIAEKIHDYVLKQNQTFVFDGTLSSYEKALENIKRSLEKSRPAFIFYVYQRPEIAWKFTEAREKAEGRNIPKEAFIEQFLGAKETVKRIRQGFGFEVTIVLVKKNFETNAVEYTQEITSNGAGIDEFIRETYTKEALEKLL